MEHEKQERWMELCKMGAKEQDPEKLLALTQEISRILDDKEARVKEARKRLADSDFGKAQPAPQ